VRGLPDLKMLGLPRNVLVWDGEQLGTWLDALGLGQVVPAYPFLNPTKVVPAYPFFNPTKVVPANPFP